MQIVVTNLVAAAHGPIQGLSDRGGIIKAGIDTVTTFTLGDDEGFEESAQAILDDLVANAKISYFLRADINDHGDRIYREELTVTHADLTDADGSQTIESTHTFPTGATLVKYRHNLAVEFAGGAINACTVDTGVSAGQPDVLADGQNVFTGAGTGYKFTAGVNAIGHDPLDLGGKKLRCKVDTTNGNVADLTAGKIVLEAFYIMQ